MKKQPHIIPVKESGDLYVLQEDFTMYLGKYGHHVNVIVRKGFRHDGASVPRWFWSLTGLTRDGMHRAAALIHDYLYTIRGKLNTYDGHPYTMNRKDVDKLFKAMLKDYGIANHRVWIAYRGVRLFGQSYWDDD